MQGPTLTDALLRAHYTGICEVLDRHEGRVLTLLVSARHPGRTDVLLVDGTALPVWDDYGRQEDGRWVLQRSGRSPYRVSPERLARLRSRRTEPRRASSNPAGHGRVDLSRQSRTA